MEIKKKKKGTSEIDFTSEIHFKYVDKIKFIFTDF